MLKLEKLAKTTTVKSSDWLDSSQTLNIIVLTVDATFSQLLYNLLFRLEGIKYGKEAVNIYLGDNGLPVTRADILLGNFVEEDYGKNRVDVLKERYGEVFTTRLYKLEKESYGSAVQNFSEYGNVVILGFNTTAEVIEKVYEDLYQGRRINKVYGGLLGLYGYTGENTVGIEMKVARKYGDLIGSFNGNESEERGKKYARAELMKTNLISQNILVFLNELIAAGLEGMLYEKWTQEMDTGKQKNKMIYGTLSIFHEYYLYGEIEEQGITKESVEEFSERYKKIEEEAQNNLLLKSLKYPRKRVYAQMLAESLKIWEHFLTAKEPEVQGKDEEKMLRILMRERENNIRKKKQENTESYDSKTGRVVEGNGGVSTESTVNYTLLKMIENQGWRIT